MRKFRVILVGAAVALSAMTGVIVTAGGANASAGDYSYTVKGYNVRASAGTGSQVLGATTDGWYQTFCWTDASGYRWFRGNYYTSNGWKTNAFVATVAIPVQAQLPHC